MPAISVILPLLLQLLQMAPQLIQTGRTVVSTVESIWAELTSNNAPTPDEQRQYDDALAAAHASFQASATRVDPPA